uniref:Tyrosine-protein kinase n=1 Tax=Panagrellus redivivus TaxID=6233 RepID=A0A7E4WDQ8_PANRE
MAEGPKWDAVGQGLHHRQRRDGTMTVAKPPKKSFAVLKPTPPVTPTTTPKGKTKQATTLQHGIPGKSPSTGTSSPSSTNVTVTSTSSTGQKSTTIAQKAIPKRQRALFYGSITKDEVALFLLKPGEFLLRNVETPPDGKRLVVSVLAKDGIKNFAVHHKDAHFYISPAHKFKTLSELLVTHIRQKIPIDGRDLYLTYAIYRPRWMLLHKNISFGKKLGEGAFGEVYIAKYQFREGTKVKMAVKTMHLKHSRADKLEFLKEARVMYSLQHNNIVRVFGVAALALPLIIAMELCTGGCLLSYLRKFKDTIPIERKTRFAYEAAKGLAYLEKVGFIHRDIAARNCMMTAQLTVKVGDFGMAEALPEMTVSELKKVPIKWLAPETMQRRIYSHKTDIWSFGITMWEIYANGDPPYQGQTNMQVRAKVVVQGYRLSVPGGTPDPVGELMHKCWLVDPAARPTFAYVEEHLAKHAEKPIKVVVRRRKKKSTSGSSGSTTTNSGSTTTSEKKKKPKKKSKVRKISAASSNLDRSMGKSGKDGSRSPTGSAEVTKKRGKKAPKV